jgi:hypothetical protein
LGRNKDTKIPIVQAVNAPRLLQVKCNAEEEGFWLRTGKLQREAFDIALEMFSPASHR